MAFFIVFLSLIMVLHEEHQPRSNSSSSGSGSRYSKKNKVKNKIPQRGLGVAQLEKLRIQEQQKNSSMSSSSSNIPKAQHQLPLLPFLSAPPRDPNFLVRSMCNCSASQNVEFFKPYMNYSVSIGFPMSNVEGLKYLLWSDKINNLDPSIIDSLQSLYHLLRIQVINNAASMSFYSSDNLQMEPPSNQNYNSSYSVNCSQTKEKKKIAGTDLPWPFQHDTASSISIPHKIPQFNNFILKPEKSSPMYGKLPVTFEHKSLGYSEEGASSSNAYQIVSKNSELHTKKRYRENGASADREFITSSSRSKQLMMILPSERLEHNELSLLQSHGRFENSTQQTFYNFLPMGPAAHEPDAIEQGDEAWNDIDTRLKL